jgi:hypothetical protein
MIKPVIAVWFSCGAASAVAAKKTIELYGSTHEIRVINNPIAEEHHDNRRFLKDVEKWLGLKIESSINSKYPECSATIVWMDRDFMSGPKGAPCTFELKKKARQQWEALNHHDLMVMGFTYDEKVRHENFKKNERDNILPVLIDLGLTKNDCFEIIKEAGIELPEIYKMGYPNANCIGCVKATSPEYWNHVRKMHPAIFKRRAKQSRDIGAKLVRVKNKRIFLDELDPLARGRSMKSMNFECGIFCEEKGI